MKHLERSGNQKKKTRFAGLFFLTGLRPVLPLGQCPPSKLYHCSDNLEPNSKDNSEYAVLCSLLRGSPDFFFLALHCNAFSYHNFEIERSQYCKWYVPRTPNSSFYFPKASCNCWKRFSVYTFPRFLFNLLWFLSLDSERLYFRISNGYVIRIRCKH